MSRKQDENFNGWMGTLLTFLAIVTVIAVAAAIIKVFQEGRCAGSAIVLVLSVLAWVPLQNVRMR